MAKGLSGSLGFPNVRNIIQFEIYEQLQLKNPKARWVDERLKLLDTHASEKRKPPKRSAMPVQELFEARS